MKTSIIYFGGHAGPTCTEFGMSINVVWPGGRGWVVASGLVLVGSTANLSFGVPAIALQVNIPADGAYLFDAPAGDISIACGVSASASPGDSFKVDEVYLIQ